MSSFANKFNELKTNYPDANFGVIVPVLLLILLCGIVALFVSFCGTTEVDMRTLAPKDTIIYLETNNLGKTLDALTESKSFKENSASKFDFSVVNGMQVAVAISGFETSENQVTDAQSVLSFKPKFTAIAETHAWSWQVNSLVENNLNDFIRRTYGSDTKLERKSVNDTERFIWTAGDGRKTFAVISDSQVFFGNDEESINKCLSAKRGESESLLRNENLSLIYEKAKGKLAFGFISNAGIKQIADLVGVTVAVGQAEDADARGFISGILPQILNKTTQEITWTAEKIGQGIEDEIFIKTENETSKILSETLVSANKNSAEILKFIPPEISSVTRYNLKNPQIAFRSLLLTTAKNTDSVNAKIISAFSNSLLASYGIADAEGFLSAIDSEIITARLNDEERFAVVKVRDFEKLKQTIVEEIDFGKEPQISEKDVKLWISEDENLAVGLIGNYFVIGDLESVRKSINNKTSINSALFTNFKQSTAVASTLEKDFETAEKITEILGKPKKNQTFTNYILTQTRFNKQGIVRKYISDYGFLGTIIEQFGGS